MKTIEITLYKFNELSEAAQQAALNKWRKNEDYEWVTSEARHTLDAFCEIFPITWSTINYDDPYRLEWSVRIEDCIAELSGQRLAKLLWNQYKPFLYKGRYYSIGKWNNGLYQYKYRNSKIILQHSCVLTGICYDNYILQPIYDYLEKPINSINFRQLLNDCMYSFIHAVASEIQYYQSDKCIIENIEINDYDFDINGNMR